MVRTGLLLAIVAMSCSGCGATHALILHAPEQRLLADANASAGEAVICVTHKTRIRGKLPARESGYSAASLDYDGSAGGALSISQTTRGAVKITCD